MHKTRKRTLTLYSVGTITAHQTLYVCPQCGYISQSRELAALAPARHTFGYDVMVYVGEAVFRHFSTDQEVKSHLRERGITISASEVALLAKKYMCYLASAHRESQALLKKHLVAQGGYILHLDGTCDGDSTHLFVGLDELSSLVLDAMKLPSEKSEIIIPFLKELERTYGTPVALVHDMGAGILHAVDEVFPHIPDYICHFHFLRDIGKDLFMGEHQRIQKRFRYYGIQTKLRAILKQCVPVVNAHPQELQELTTSITGSSWKVNTSLSPELLLYTLIHWAFAGKKQKDGYGFPFDRPYMVFFERLRKLKATIYKLRLHQQSSVAESVLTVLQPLWYDQQLITAEKRLHEKVNVFEQLRCAMSIAEPGGIYGLNDQGSGTIQTIEAQVTEFYQQLITHEDQYQGNEYRKMRKQIEKYWKRLFAAPIQVMQQGQTVLLYPQRTNNILEQFFRSMKHAHCRKSGYARMYKSINAMLSVTPLVKNLDQPDYLKLILNGCSSLEERFAQIDSSVVQKLLAEEAQSTQFVDPKIKKMIRNPNFPSQLIKLVLSA